MRALLAALLAAGLCLASTVGYASTSVEALLREAEAVRSADPRQFQRLLAKLHDLRGQATARQAQHLAYLEAYGTAYSGNYPAAIQAARKLADSAIDVETRFRAGALLVNSYAVTRQITEGLRQLEQTLALAPRIKDPTLRQHVLVVAAVIYTQAGQDRVALEYAERLLAENPPERTQCFAGQIKLEAQQRLGSLPADDGVIDRLVARCVAQGEVVVANLARATLARKWAQAGDTARAIAMLSARMAEVEATRYPRLVGESHSLLAELLLANGDLAGAERHARSAIAKRVDMVHSLPLVTAYKVLYDVANRQGNAAAALAAYRSYSEADKAYVNDVKARELAYQMVRQETAQKSQQIALLDRENRVLQLQRRVDRQAAQNTQLVVALLVLLLASIGYWAYKTKRVQMSLRRLAESDVLTGLCNRHHFTQQAQAALAQAQRSGEPVALIMFDLDHFKSINDTYGHVTGDWVLRQVSQTCSGFCRSIDCIGRWGGEEFAILLTGCQLQDAVRLADDCRVRLSQIDTRDSGHTFPVSASFGVASSLYSGHELSRLLSHSDQALYRAKRAGRDRVEAYLPDEPRHLVDHDSDHQHGRARHGEGERNAEADASAAGASPAQG